MRSFLAALFLCLISKIAAAQGYPDDRYPSWSNRMTGYVEVKEPRWNTGTVPVSRYDCRRKGQCNPSKRTASGEPFSLTALTFAHKKMRFGTRVRFSYRGRSVECRCNDRGPFVRHREFDLAEACARAIGVRGVAHVRAVRI